MRLSNVRSTVALALLVSLSPAIAKNDEQTKANGARVHHDFLAAPTRDAVPGQKELAPSPVVPPRKAVAAFSRSENAVVRDYFVRHPMKWTALPPGLVKEYGRGKPLPLGVEKKELPWGLTKRLPLRLGCEYRQVGRDVVIIDKETLLVIDIMKDVFG